MIEESARISKNPNVVHRTLQEGAVLLHLESGQYHGLNEVGTLLWELLDEERDLAGLVAATRKRLEDPPHQLEVDVARFLANLRDRDLITVDKARGD
jgi:hypothetical protein